MDTNLEDGAAKSALPLYFLAAWALALVGVGAYFLICSNTDLSSLA